MSWEFAEADKTSFSEITLDWINDKAFTNSLDKMSGLWQVSDTLEQMTWHNYNYLKQHKARWDLRRLYQIQKLRRVSIFQQSIESSGCTCYTPIEETQDAFLGGANVAMGEGFNFKSQRSCLAKQWPQQLLSAPIKPQWLHYKFMGYIHYDVFIFSHSWLSLF